MIKNYLLHGADGMIKQFTKCDESEIELYQSEYIEYDKDSFEFDPNYTYKVQNGVIVKTERNDSYYLLTKANADFEAAVSRLTASIPASEVSTWTKQEQEARAYLLDNSSLTPLIDAICLARGIDKSYLVDKIIEKADAYAVAIGTLTGNRQKQEKLIAQG